MQQFDGVGVEIVGPRSSEPTRQIVDFVRNNRLPYTWHDTEQVPDAAIEGLGRERLPLVRLPGGHELFGPSSGHVSHVPGIFAAGDVRSGSVKRAPRPSAKEGWPSSSSTPASQSSPAKPRAATA